MSAVFRKGEPSQSYPRKLAPLASFDGSIDDGVSPVDGSLDGGSLQGASNRMPEIAESEEPIHRPVTQTSSGSASFGGPSGLHTPSTPATPRIDISCASSSTESPSADDAEIFPGGLVAAFREDGTQELRSSTEELELGDGDIDDSEEERRKRRKEREGYGDRDDLLRKASLPANIYSRRRSSPFGNNRDDQDEAELQRKPSAHTLFLDGLLSRPRHASFGSGEYSRPGAVSSCSVRSTGSLRGSRSPSPHKMMLTTSFCGNKPIPTKSMEAESPPKEEAPEEPADPIQYLTPSSSQKKTERKREPRSPTRKSEKEALEKPFSLPPPEIEATKKERSLSVKSIALSPHSPPHTPEGGPDSRRPSATSASGRRSVSPFKMVYETSFCGSKPIATKSIEIVDSPPGKKDEELTILHIAAQVHSTSPRVYSPSKSSDHWRPITPKSGQQSPSPHSQDSSPSVSQATTKYVSTPNPAHNLKLHTSNVFKWPEPPQPSEEEARKSPLPPPPPEFGDEVTTELRFKEDASLPVEEAEFLQDKWGDEDGDLPYVPTTLPQEKPVGMVFPSRERRAGSLPHQDTIPLQRPKVNKQPQPACLTDYINNSTASSSSSPLPTEAKMKIKIPRDDSQQSPGGPNTPPQVRSRGSIGATNWQDFAEMGLRSPRDLRKRMREENGD